MWHKQQDLWWKGDEVVRVPANDGIKTLLLEDAHDHITSGHGGVEKTLQRLREYWF